MKRNKDSVVLLYSTNEEKEFVEQLLEKKVKIIAKERITSYRYSNDSSLVLLTSRGIFENKKGVEFYINDMKKDENSFLRTSKQ